MTAIRQGLLSELFVGVVAKQLTLVETITPKSNQHEFQGTKPLRQLFGVEDRRGIPTRFVWLSGEQTALSEDGFMSWSNVRKGKPRAPEYHLYYSGNAVTEAMQPGDTMFLALRPDGQAMIIIAPSGSTMQSQLRWLFTIAEQATFGFEYRDITNDEPAQLDFAARYILDELGIELEEPETDQLDGLIEQFGTKFPTTRDFSAVARESLSGFSPHSDADTVLMTWLEREELLFRRLERHIVAARLRSGFMPQGDADVDGFLAFSLSVQNRRKSRAGQSLENHLEALFKARGIRYSRGAETENRHKPDFLFPGTEEYHDARFPAARLTMLASKSTLKDRWRQVLTEAARIPAKHLLTLEPAISEHQTDQMKAVQLQLVLPAILHNTYRDSQRPWLISVSEFLEKVRYNQD